MKRKAQKLVEQAQEPVFVSIFPDEPPVKIQRLPLGSARPLECLLPMPVVPRRSRELPNREIEWYDDTSNEDYVVALNTWLAKAGAFAVYLWLRDNPDYEFTATPEAHGVTLPLPAGAVPSKYREAGVAWLTALRDELVAEGVTEETLISYGAALCTTVVTGPLSRVRV